MFVGLGPVVLVPGNRVCCLRRDGSERTSFDKFVEVNATAAACGASVHPFSRDGVTIVPLLTWYDYSFGEPSEELKSVWMDFRACRWPAGFSERDVAAYFSALNAVHVDAGSDTVITYSHFVPRLDLMPDHIPQRQRYLYPVLGASRLDAELRRLRPQMHVYGHSHINRRVVIDGVCYINNAFGYPHEHQTTAKRLLCVHGDATARPTVSRGANEP